MLGTSIALFKNYLKGVSEGFWKKLELEGVGYKVQADGNSLVLALGFTHPVKIPAPEGVTFKVENNQKVNPLIGDLEIRGYYKPESLDLRFEEDPNCCKPGNDMESTCQTFKEVKASFT